MKRVFFLSTLIVAMLCLVVVGIARYRDWRTMRLLERAKEFGTRSELEAMIGLPYQVYDRFPSPLGAGLLDESELDRSDVLICAYLIQKLPPVFLVVKVEKERGVIMRLSLQKS